jgi:hypothetical protein
MVASQAWAWLSTSSSSMLRQQKVKKSMLISTDMSAASI